MTAPAQAIGAMSSGRVFLGELLSSRARLRFPGHPQAPTITPVRRHNCSERQTGTSHTVYCTPRSEWCTSPGAGWRVSIAWRSAAMANPVSSRSSSAQPTTLRE